MFLKGNLISVRAMEPNDSELLYHWENNRELWNVSLTQTPFSKFVLDEFVDTAHQDIYTNKQLRLMINDLASNETIGTIDLFEFEPQHARCGLGIYILEEYRGKGYASECLSLIKNYVFTNLHLHQLYALVADTNKPSLALFEKSGFSKSGLKKSWNRNTSGGYDDVWFLQYIFERA